MRTPQGEVQIDPTGKKSGRGAYLCRQYACWEAALKRDKLAHALKATVSQLDRAALEEYSKELKAEAPDDNNESR